jgi:hypothetical protein
MGWYVLELGGYSIVDNIIHLLYILYIGKITDILDRIKEQVDETVGYMAESVKKTLMSREFRKPGRVDTYSTY